MSDVQETLAQLIFQKTGHQVQADDTLATLEMDSLATAELTAELEKKFGIQVGEDILDVQTVQELSEYLTLKVANRG